MAKILYSLAQEGMGHASRGIVLLRRLLAKGHCVTVLTGGDSFIPIDKALKGKRNAKLISFPGLRQKYDSKGRISYAKTISYDAKLLKMAPKIIRWVEGLLERERFDLVVSDFEPFVARAAKHKGFKFITLDNQHRIVYEKPDLKDIKDDYLAYSVTRQVVKYYHPLGAKCIITSSFPPKIPKSAITKKLKIIVTGPILRKEAEDLRKKVRKEDFILVYVKKPLEKAIIPKLSKIKGHRFVMFVKYPAEHRKVPNIELRKQGPEFLQYLSRCKAVVSSAGEQLMSEALFLKKPLFLLPEEGQFEQTYNAILVRKHGVGDYSDISKLKPEQIEKFLSRLPVYESALKKRKVRNGAGEIIKVIEGELKRKEPAR